MSGKPSIIRLEPGTGSSTSSSTSARSTRWCLRARFAEYGEVLSADIVTDRDTGQPRGFGFVEMDAAAAAAAIEALDQLEHDGRNLKVNDAKPRDGRSAGRDRGARS